MRRSRFILPTALLSFVTASAAAPAQAPFHGGVDLVALDVCATDRLGHPVSITPDDLAVFDNGTRQRVVVFAEGAQVPLAVTLLVDSSQSTRSRCGRWERDQFPDALGIFRALSLNRYRVATYFLTVRPASTAA